MQTFLQQLVNGVVVGSIYAVVALGYTMVYGILGLINFAHGDVLMVGALTGMTAIHLLQAAFPQAPAFLHFLGALGVAVPVCMALGYVIERGAYRRLRNAPRLAPLITAIGVSLLLQTLGMLIWGRSYHAYPQLISTAPWHLGSGVFLTPVQLTTILVSAGMMVGLWLLVQRTRLGRAMRATAENDAVASLMGVNTDRVISQTFLLGSALAAVAGVMIGSNYGVAHYSMGFLPGLKAFTAAVLGGIGNLPGAMLGGLLLGILEALGAGYIESWTGGWLNSSYQNLFAFLILGVVLVFRPTGLLGERVSDRA